MKPLFEITTTNGQFWYDLFYITAILFAGVFFMLDGKRKKYPMAEWSLIFSSGIVFLIAGTKVMTYTPDDWKTIISTCTFPYTERKTILGGILGAILGIWIAKKLIRFPHPVLDSFAVSFPLAMAIQRIGCLMVGCCYGTPTELPWAVRYSSQTMGHLLQPENEWINSTSCHTLNLHPNQLYQSLLCLTIAFIIWRMRNLWKRPGNLFFTSIGLYWIARFIVEFWRDGASNGIAGETWMGLKYLQWALLGAILCMAVFIALREKRFSPKIMLKTGMVHPVWYFILLCLFVLTARHWFTQTEFLFIELVIAPTCLLQINKIIEEHAYSFRYRVVSVCSLALIFILSGTVIAQEVEVEYKRTISRNTFNDIKFGYGYFQYDHYHSPPVYLPGPNGCSGTPSYYYYEPVGPEFKHNSHMFSTGINHIETYGDFNKLTLNGDISLGWDMVNGSNPEMANFIYDLSPAMQYDFRWYGIGFGFHYGSAVKDESKGGVNYSTDDKTKEYITWSGSLRVFPYDIVYTELRFNEYYPYQIGQRSGYAQFVIGTGFGLTNGTAFELGYDGNAGGFISAKALLFDKIGLSASYYTTDDEINYHQLMQFSVSYRFHQKHWTADWY